MHGLFMFFPPLVVGPFRRCHDSRARDRNLGNTPGRKHGFVGAPLAEFPADHRRIKITLPPTFDKTGMSERRTLREVSCADDYDPNSMPVDKARALIRELVGPIGVAERLNVRAALGRVLAEDIVSPIDVPGHDNSAMDGWAVRFADLSTSTDTELSRIGESFAGKPFAGEVGAGHAVRIFTGGVMPKGADTVVMQERASETARGVRVSAGAVSKVGQNRRFAGEDVKRGQLVFRAGQPLRPAELGMLASLGIGEITVYRRLRVAFFSTGDELRAIGEPLGAGEVYDSNRYTLHGMLTRLGCEVIDMGVVPDVPASLERALVDAAASADVVITSGGVSVGEADYVKDILGKLGEVLFWKIALKPGRPLAYGRVKGAHFFGLPGNPVSVMVTFYQFVRDALLIMQGRRNVEPVPTFTAALATPIRKAAGRTEFQRGILSRGDDGEWRVRTTGEQGSGILSSMSQANCFIVLGSETGNLEAGEKVDVQLLEGMV
jgi:molybdopterin molybdotransferase